MYAWIWRKLPFGFYGKLTSSLILTVGVTALLWYVAFPWAQPLLPFDDVQVGTTTGDQPTPGGSIGRDGPGLGPDDEGHNLPYDITSNNPEPSRTATR